MTNKSDNANNDEPQPKSEATPSKPKSKLGKVINKKLSDQKIDELTQALQRERADADNIRKHAEQAKAQALNRGKEIAAEQMLGLVDNLERAFAHSPKALEDDPWVKGILGLQKQLDKLLLDFGLTKIITLDQEFDPETMQAISAEDQGLGKEVVIEELQAGYMLNGKVIRVAMVKVAQ